MQRGVTLAETLIAMAILSSAIVALLGVVSQNSRAMAYVESNLYAEIIADNILVSEMIRSGFPTDTSRSGVSEINEQDWFWNATVTETSIPGFYRVAVSVRHEPDGQTQSEVSAFRTYGG